MAWYEFPLIFLFIFTLHYVKYLRKKRIIPFRNLSSQISWLHGFKQLWAYFLIQRFRRIPRSESTVGYSNQFLPNPKLVSHENPTSDKLDGVQVLRFAAGDHQGRVLLLAITLQPGQWEMLIKLKDVDGTVYSQSDSPQTLVFKSDKQGDVEWDAGGLRFEILEPGLRLRIVFNGLLYAETIDGQNREHHVRFNFIWHASGECLDIKQIWHPLLLADAVAREDWSRHELRHLMKDLGRGFDQWGSAIGILTIDSKVPVEVHLLSLRQRRWGSAETFSLERSMGLIGFTDHGLGFFLRLTSHPIGLRYARFGHAILPNGKQVSVKDCEVNVENLPEQNSIIPKAILFNFTAESANFTGCLELKTETITTGDKFFSKQLAFEMELQGRRGFALAELWYRDDNQKGIKYAISKNKFDMGSSLIVKLNDMSAQVRELTGGKGSSLAQLFSFYENKFLVPNGFCLTVNAWRNHLIENPTIQNDISLLEETTDDQSLKSLCERISTSISNSKLNPQLATIIEEALAELNLTNLELAVRSSALGEDSSDSSSAGQNETFLGVSSKELFQAIANCWASNYSLKSVQYRISRGRPRIDDMCVVIQELVHAEKAGVLFTSDPVTGDPRKIYISASYGLGESVVSGKVDPDTIVVTRTSSGGMKITDKVCGRKNAKIETTDLCLNEEESLTLAAMAVEVERFFGGTPCDIEWAICNSKVHLLQARSITTNRIWTDFEFLHEFDDSIMSNFHLTTTANTGEVFPGISTPLTTTTLLAILSRGSYSIVTLSHHRVFLDLHKSIFQAPRKDRDISLDFLCFSIMGRLAITSEHHAAALIHQKPSLLNTIKNILFIGKCFIRSSKYVREASGLAKSLNQDWSDHTCKSKLFEDILKQLHIVQRIHEQHYRVSASASMAQVVLFMTLVGGQSEINDTCMRDLLKIFNLYKSDSSAIPIALKKLAQIIACESKLAEQFCQLDPENCSDFLKSKLPDAAGLWERFLENFGHRSIREMELSTKVWKVDPKPIFRSLQTQVRHLLNTPDQSTSTKSSVTIDELLASLETPLKPLQKKIIRLFVSLCGSNAKYREQTKENLILSINVLRTGFLKLAEMLRVDPELIFYLTLWEVQELVEGRGSSLLVKAQKRRNLGKTWDTLTFSDMMIGLPKALPKIEIDSDRIGQIRGCPAFPGKVIAPAVVLKDLSDLDNSDSLQGCVLITRYTDIGWSPYFPLLVGIVTELGGLISHGAVVAREYGLPCIVGARDATSAFKTGDMVLLDASNGRVAKL